MQSYSITSRPTGRRHCVPTLSPLRFGWLFRFAFFWVNQKKILLKILGTKKPEYYRAYLD